MTLVYEAGSEIHWTRVNELVIGELYRGNFLRVKTFTIWSK